MSHWFDDAALSTVEGPKITRRVALKGAAVGLAATSSLGTLTSLVRPSAAVADQVDCDNCMERALADANAQRRKCRTAVPLAALAALPLSPYLLFYCLVSITAEYENRIWRCQSRYCPRKPPDQGDPCEGAKPRTCRIVDRDPPPLPPAGPPAACESVANAACRSSAGRRAPAPTPGSTAASATTAAGEPRGARADSRGASSSRATRIRRFTEEHAARILRSDTRTDARDWTNDHRSSSAAAPTLRNAFGHGRRGTGASARPFKGDRSDCFESGSGDFKGTVVRKPADLQGCPTSRTYSSH